MVKKSNKIRDALPAILLIVALLVAWQIAAIIIDKTHILPTPTAIVVKTWELRSSLLLHHLPSTMVTVGTGWALSIAIGILLAVLMHASKRAEAMLHPALLVTQTIPVLCISPLFVLWLGYTLQARLIAVVLSTFFAITLNVYDGLQAADINKKEWMLSCGASRKNIFFHLEVPSALPRFMTALKMTFPWAVIDAAVAEWLGATQGLGYLSKRMIAKMDGAAVFAPLLVLTIVTLIGMAVLKWVDKKYITWRADV